MLPGPSPSEWHEFGAVAGLVVLCAALALHAFAAVRNHRMAMRDPFDGIKQVARND